MPAAASVTVRPLIPAGNLHSSGRGVKDHRRHDVDTDVSARAGAVVDCAS